MMGPATRLLTPVQNAERFGFSHLNVQTLTLDHIRKGPRIWDRHAGAGASEAWLVPVVDKMDSSAEQRSVRSSFEFRKH